MADLDRLPPARDVNPLARERKARECCASALRFECRLRRRALVDVASVWRGDRLAVGVLERFEEVVVARS
jgi:hypothetical protein